MTPNDIVQKLWNLCDVLRDDGINYSDKSVGASVRCLRDLFTSKEAVGFCRQPLF